MLCPHFPGLSKFVMYVESVFPCYFLLNMKVIRIYYLLLINPCKFFSGCLYVPYNLEELKDPKFFKEKHKLIASLFMLQQCYVFSFQNKLQSTGLEPCQRLVINLTRLNVFSCMILQCWHNILGGFITILYCVTLKNIVAWQFYLKGHNWYTKVYFFKGEVSEHPQQLLLELGKYLFFMLFQHTILFGEKFIS